MGIQLHCPIKLPFPTILEEKQGKNVCLSFLTAFRCAHKIGISSKLVVKYYRFMPDHITLKQLYKVQCTGVGPRGPMLSQSPRSWAVTGSLSVFCLSRKSLSVYWHNLGVPTNYFKTIRPETVKPVLPRTNAHASLADSCVTKQRPFPSTTRSLRLHMNRHKPALVSPVYTCPGENPYAYTPLRKTNPNLRESSLSFTATVLK